MTDIDTARTGRHGPQPRRPVRLALASRGDALTPYLFDAMERRYPVLGRIDPELTSMQRYEIAALTFRPSRSAWVERFYKSGAARRMRSLNAVQQLRRLPEPPDAVLQVHLLFDVPTEPAVLYIDCTHRQSAEQWPAWNPLRGRALNDWYRREHASYHAAQHIFAFSESARDSLVLDYAVPSDRVTVTGGGVNFHTLPDAPGQRPRTVPTILFVGNDFTRKGGHVLLEAFRLVRQTMPDARLRLVGTPPRIAPEPGVEVLGRIRDRRRIAELYEEATVFALPSYFDPYPLVTLEAMASGVPVVATAQSGTPEIVAHGETGLLVAPGRADQLAEALLRVLRDDELAGRLRRAARTAVEERFTWDAVVRRMAPALDALTRGRG